MAEKPFILALTRKITSQSDSLLDAFLDLDLDGDGS
jgi:hypothetical protein